MESLKTAAALDLHAKPVQLIADISQKYLNLPEALPHRAAMKKLTHRIRAKVRENLPAEPTDEDWAWDMEFFEINGEPLIVREWKQWDEKKNKLHRVTLVSTVTLFGHFCRSHVIQT